MLDKLIIFFFIDNIICLALKENILAINKFKRDLTLTYNIKIISKVRWFLRIRVKQD